MDAGTFSGPGTVSPALNVVGGTLHPGADPGTLAISGPATVAAGASVTGVVDGTAAAQYDRLAATGALTVGGSLTLSRGPDYSPTNGDTFTVASGGSRTGTFANVTQDLSFAGWYFTPTYTSTSAGGHHPPCHRPRFDRHSDRDRFSLRRPHPGLVDRERGERRKRGHIRPRLGPDHVGIRSKPPELERQRLELQRDDHGHLHHVRQCRIGDELRSHHAHRRAHHRRPAVHHLGAFGLGWRRRVHR